MSIYCSRVTLGFDHWGGRKGRQNGRVAAYPNNDLRLVDGEDWPDGNVDTSHIPSWCVPGNEHSANPGSFEEISEWLRLSVSANGAHLSVLVDEKAVRLLVKDLKSWLKQPKALAK
jgi:hypothetical protein